MKLKSLLVSILALLSFNIAQAQKTYKLKSPDKTITMTIEVGDDITYTVMHGNTLIIKDSQISMELNDGNILGRKAIVKKTKSKKVNEIIEAHFYKKSQVENNYNELTINFKGNYKLTFRAFDDGVAYRFSTSFKNPIVVKKENVTYKFANDYTAYVPYVNARKGDGDFTAQQFFTSFESQYTISRLSEMDVERIAFTPLLINVDDGKKVVIVESDLEDYPGTFFRKGEGNSLISVQSTYPKVEEQGGHNMLQLVVKEREEYIAKTKGTRDFPWRAMVISENDTELMNSDMVYKLASPSRIDDLSWIKPGKVAWDWWNNWNIKGVDFEAGINNDTYKYYIDFASKYGIEYVILDEGWAVNKQADLFQVVPEINLEELVDYANKKNVGLVLWVGYYAVDRDMEHVCKHYSKMGIKGFKVDFMDRDDQKVVDFYYRMAAMAAKYHLFVDFHGAYKPTGLNRTYPNVLNFEGVYGLEQSKWDDATEQVTYETMIPFIRMVAGYLDYTQGAMDNANKYNFRAIYSNPMSQGTRCRQLAEYVIFESPFNMMCDSPTKYMDNAECTQYIAEVPTIWDETIALDGKLGEYAVIARRSGGKWYIGAITNWDERTIEIDLSKLNLKVNKGVMFRDGVNANRYAEDYVKENISVKDNKITLQMKKGGGAVVIL